MAVIDQLASRRPTLSETQQVNYAVKTGLEQLEKAFAGNATFFLGNGKGTTELAFQKSVYKTELLLFSEANRIFGKLTP